MPSPSSTGRTYTRISSTSPRRRHWVATSAPRSSQIQAVPTSCIFRRPAVGHSAYPGAPTVSNRSARSTLTFCRSGPGPWRLRPDAVYNLPKDLRPSTKLLIRSHRLEPVCVGHYSELLEAL